MKRIDFILDACHDKRVLHVGCSDSPATEEHLADGSLLHSMIDNVAKEQYGIDIDPAGIKIMRNAGFKNVAVGNVEDLLRNNPFGRTDFHVIVAGEIIEHLSNPGLFLDSIKPLMCSPNSKLVITTVNAFYAMRFFLCMVTGRESVHPDHVSYYSRSTLEKLLQVHGYEIDQFSYYSISEAYEKSLKKGQNWILWGVDRVSTKFFPPVLSDGIMVTCKVRACTETPEDSDGQSQGD